MEKLNTSCEINMDIFGAGLQHLGRGSLGVGLPAILRYGLGYSRIFFLCLFLRIYFTCRSGSKSLFEDLIMFIYNFIYFFGDLALFLSMLLNHMIQF